MASMVTAVTAVGQAIASASGSPAAARAAQRLSPCCETFTRSIWPDVAWRFSELTADGSPLEFTFSSADNSLRYTVDVAPPETQNHDRIAAACELAARLDQPPVDAKSVQRWSLMQQGHSLLSGAFLGVRESGNQAMIKFYVEVPLEAQPAIRSLINPPLQDSIAVMMGYEPQSARTEYYFWQQQLSSAQLDRLLGTMGSDEERATMRAGIEHVCGMPVASALQWTCFGYSLAFGPRTPAPPKLALFVRSRAIGGAVRVRRRMLSCMRPSVKERSLYYRLLAGLPEAQLPDHGVVSISCLQPGVAEMRVGLSGIALSHLLQENPLGEGVGRSCLSL